MSRNKLFDIRNFFHTIINFLGETDILRMIPYDYHLRMAHSILIDEIQKHTIKRQTTISNYFKRPSTSDISMPSKPHHLGKYLWHQHPVLYNGCRAIFNATLQYPKCLVWMWIPSFTSTIPHACNLTSRRGRGEGQ